MRATGSWRVTGAMIGLAVLLCLPALIWLGTAWFVNDYYSHGPLVLVVSLFFAWLAWRHMKTAQEEATDAGREIPDADSQAVSGRGKVRWVLMSWSGRICLIIAAAFYIWGLRILHPTPIAFALLFFIAGFILHFRGTRAMPLLFPVGLMAMAVPVPYLDNLGRFLQSLSAVSSTWLVERLGQHAILLQNTVVLGNTRYEIAIACSGLNKVMPLFSLVAIMAYCLQATLFKRALLFALVIPLALVTNIIRLSVTLLIGARFGPETAVGFYHDVSSLFFFIVALLLLGFISHFLKILQPRREVFV